jgi:hypothetical protein
MNGSEASAFLAALERTVLSHPVLTNRLWADLEHGRCGHESLRTFTVYARPSRGWPGPHG